MDPGTRLGPYEILEQLGAGGMGEVYLAEDTRLHRKVAVKVLPDEFAADPERLARFEQEARAAAALNHPHIAVIHDIGAADGTHFMVQEYLQGQTLRDSQDGGALPLRKALVLGAEIAEALSAAHRAGIVHRDLKPDNVFVTENDHAKVLDFGLAKLTEAGGTPVAGATMSPTVLGTQAGVIMGTAGYMAPEQVNGLAVDHRADVFAFGCVLYEMATGKRAFAGRNVLDTLGLIVDQEPEPVTLLDARLPAELQRIVRKCVAKDPARRYQSADDLVVDLRTLATDLETGAVDGNRGVADQPVTAPAPRGRLVFVASLVLTAVLAAFAGWWLTRSEPPAAAEVVRFDIELPEGRGFRNLIPGEITISPDGSALVFVAGDQLWMRTLDNSEAQPLRNTQDAWDPFFSPDGRQLGFAAQRQLMKIAIDGGPVTTLGPVTGQAGDGPYWGEDGYIYVAGEPGGIIRYPGEGGAAELAIPTEAGEDTGGPQLLPGGEWVLYTEAPGAELYDDAQIVAQSLVSGERRTIVQVGRQARVTPTGHLLWVRQGVLFGQAFDARRLELHGEAVALVEGVRESTGNRDATAHYNVSDNGTLIYLEGEADQGLSSEFVWVDRDGIEEVLPFDSENFQAGRIAPDGRRVAVQALDSGGVRRIWLYEVDRPRGQLLTSEGGRFPVWSPDGVWVYYSQPTNRGGISQVWRKRADLSGAPELVVEIPGDVALKSVSADGTLIAYESNNAGNWDVGLLTLGHEPTATDLIATADRERRPSLAPDGRFVAYESWESGVAEIYVLRIETGQRWLISTAGGNLPAWLKSGDEISYVTAVGERAVVAVTTEPEFTFGLPRVLSRSQITTLVTSFVEDADVAPDGQRFLELRPAGLISQGAERRIKVVLNWFEELKARVPTSR
jgi:serine/threonine-protein kinase